MSDDNFLKVCRQRAGENNKSGSELRTVYQSPAYHRLLGYAERLEERIKLLERNNARLTVNNTYLREQIEELTDEIRVQGELNEMDTTG